MWEIITKIGTPFSLVAFIVAVIFKYLNGRINKKLNLIKLAPSESRASLIEAALETYNLKEDNLTKLQKYDLIKTVLKNNANRFNISALIFFIITIIILIISSFIAPALIEKKENKVELKNQISNIVQNLNYNDIDRSKSYLFQLENILKTDSSKEIRELAFEKLKSFYKSQTESVQFGYKTDEYTDPARELRNQVLQLMIGISNDKLNLLLSPNDFEYIDLANSDFSNKNLSGISFKGCFLINTNFENANLENCNFNDSFLRFTNFKNSNIKNASFENADWYNANNLELMQFSKINRKSIKYVAPESVDELIKGINDEYSFKFSDYGELKRKRLKDNWALYLKKGGLIEVANSW